MRAFFQSCAPPIFYDGGFCQVDESETVVPKKEKSTNTQSFDFTVAELQTIRILWLLFTDCASMCVVGETTFAIVIARQTNEHAGAAAQQELKQCHGNCPRYFFHVISWTAVLWYSNKKDNNLAKYPHWKRQQHSQRRLQCEKNCFLVSKSLALLASVERLQRYQQGHSIVNLITISLMTDTNRFLKMQHAKKPDWTTIVLLRCHSRSLKFVALVNKKLTCLSDLMSIAHPLHHQPQSRKPTLFFKFNTNHKFEKTLSRAILCSSRLFIAKNNYD